MAFSCCSMTKTSFPSESTSLLETDHKQKYTQKVQRVYIASRGRKCALLLSCIMQLIICNGVGYGLSVMYAELIIVFDAKRADAAWVQSLYCGLSCASGVLFTRMINKLGEGVCIMIGGVFSGVGLFISAFANSLVPIIFWTGIFAGVPMGICFLSAYIATSKMFKENSSFYLITLTLGISIGQFIVPLLFETFIAKYAWTGAFILIAGVTLQCVPSGIVIHHSKRYYPKTYTRTQDTSNTFSYKSLLTEGMIWIFLLNFFLIAVTGNVEAWFIVDHMISRGFARELGSITVSVLGVGSCLGRIFGALLRFRFAEFPTVNHWIYICCLGAVLHLIIINLYDFLSILIACFLFGIIIGTTFSQVPAIMFEATSLEKYPGGMSLVNIVMGLGDLVGPLLGGFIRDVSGRYEILFYISSGIGVHISISTLLVALCIRPRRRL